MFEKYKLIVVLKNHCPWCQMLKNQTLPMVNAMGISVFAVSGSAVEAHYGVEAFPALIYTDTSGKKLYLEEGYVPVERVVEVFSKLERGEDPNESDVKTADSSNEVVPTDAESDTPIVEPETEAFGPDGEATSAETPSEDDDSDLSPREKYALKHRESNT